MLDCFIKTRYEWIRKRINWALLKEFTTERKNSYSCYGSNIEHHLFLKKSRVLTNHIALTQLLKNMIEAEGIIDAKLNIAIYDEHKILANLPSFHYSRAFMIYLNLHFIRHFFIERIFEIALIIIFLAIVCSWNNIRFKIFNLSK